MTGKSMEEGYRLLRCRVMVGSPWERVVERDSEYLETDMEYEGKQSIMEPQHSGRRMLLNIKRMRDQGRDHDNPFPTRVTTGFTPTCACPTADPVPCTVFDPFCGIGTTLLVARKLGRHGVELDLSFDYYLRDQARERLSLTALGAWQGCKKDGSVIDDLPLFDVALDPLPQT
jgi:hypothetical protein